MGWMPMLLMLLSSIITASFGFYINDLFDIKDDAAAGKHNQVGLLKKQYRIPLLIVMIALSILPWIAIGFKVYIKVLLIAQYTFFISYSVPPLRLKTNKFFALLLDSLYSGTLFYLIALMVANNDDYSINKYIVWAILFGWGFSKGLRNILLHVIMDRENDKKAGVNTLATNIPMPKILNAIAYILIPVEIVFFVLLAWLLVLNNNAGFAIIIGYGVFLLYLLAKPIFSKDKHSLINFYRLNDFYEIFLPAILLALLAYMVDYRYAFVFVIHYLLFPRVILKLKKLLK